MVRRRREVTVRFRCTVEQADTLWRAAHRSRVSLSDLARAAVLREAAKILVATNVDQAVRRTA